MYSYSQPVRLTPPDDSLYSDTALLLSIIAFSIHFTPEPSVCQALFYEALLSSTWSCTASVAIYRSSAEFNTVIGSSS